MRTLEDIDVELSVHLNALSNAHSNDDDEAVLEAKVAHVEELSREKCRALGWSEKRIARHERERDAEFEWGTRVVDESHVALNPLHRILRRRALQCRNLEPEAKAHSSSLGALFTNHTLQK
jgi:hypothetical protein